MIALAVDITVVQRALHIHKDVLEDEVRFPPPDHHRRREEVEIPRTRRQRVTGLLQESHLILRIGGVVAPEKPI